MVLTALVSLLLTQSPDLGARTETPPPVPVAIRGSPLTLALLGFGAEVEVRVAYATSVYAGGQIAWLGGVNVLAGVRQYLPSYGAMRGPFLDADAIFGYRA